jgi:hypothetical protein
MKTRFERMFAKLKAIAKSPSDRSLIAVFEKHEKAIAEHYESCVPALDGSDFWKYTPTKDYPLNQFHGPLFHKGFRQHDITGSAHDDMQIWHLLSGMGDEPHSEAFWEAHEFSMKTRAALKGEQPAK